MLSLLSAQGCSQRDSPKCTEDEDADKTIQHVLWYVAGNTCIQRGLYVVSMPTKWTTSQKKVLTVM